MKDNSLTKPDALRRQQFVILTVLLLSLLFSVRGLYAGTLDECLMEALKNSDDSLTVGQLREQCRHENTTGSMVKLSQDDSAVEKGNAPESNITGENSSAPLLSKGPADVILKTSLGRKPAHFPHKIHQDKYTCGTCHHGKDSSGMLARYTEETTIYKCTTCHNANMPNEELNNFQSIGHKLCRECHRKNQDITSAKCSTCHRKNL